MKGNKALDREINHKFNKGTVLQEELVSGGEEVTSKILFKLLKTVLPS